MIELVAIYPNLRTCNVHYTDVAKSRTIDLESESVPADVLIFLARQDLTRICYNADVTIYKVTTA